MKTSRNVTPSKGYKLLTSPGRFIDSHKDPASQRGSATIEKSVLANRCDEILPSNFDSSKKKVFTPSQAASLVCEDSQKSLDLNQATLTAECENVISQENQTRSKKKNKKTCGDYLTRMD